MPKYPNITVPLTGEKMISTEASFWCRTPSGSGTIVVRDGVVVDCSPVFRRRWLGVSFRAVTPAVLAPLRKSETDAA